MVQKKRKKPDSNQEESRAFQIMDPLNYVASVEENLAATNNALLRALRSAGVQFLRYLSVDPYNNYRSKAVPLNRLLNNSMRLDNQVSMAEVCFGGLPSHADVIVEGTTIDARRVLVVKPDFNTLRILPYARKTAMIIGNMHDPSTDTLSPLCTRGLLARVVETAEEKHGIIFQVGAELEFTLVRDVGYLKEDGEVLQLPEPIDSSVFANTTMLTDQEDFISDVHQKLSEQDIEIELIHAESGIGQLELVLKYQSNAIRLADQLILARETIRAVARAHKLRSIFLPKTNLNQAGNGLHLHLSFRDLDSSRPQENAFPNCDNLGYVCRKGEAFMEGILEHLPSLLALTIPSVNSFRRVGKGCWTGHTIAWNTEDKEAALRVCLDLETREATNVELKLSDSMANIYLELASVLSAGLNGIVKGLKLRPSLEAEKESTPLPTSFAESLEHLKNNKFLQSVLGDDLFTNYIAVRSAEEALARDSNIESEFLKAYNKA